MRTNRNMLTALVCPLLFAAGLTGCGDLFTEDAGGCAMPSVKEPSYVMFNVTSVSNSGRTRADNNPTGGEWGDGREIGQTYENEVTSLVVFLYQDQNQSQENKGVNGEADTPVTMLYFNNNEVSGEQNTASTDNIDYIASTTAKEVQLDAGQYNVLAIANPKNLTWASEATNLTLGDVRDHIETSAWDETTTGDGIITDVTTVYSNFLMTSENEGKGVTIESSNTKEKPAVATVDVERMAARVDYQATGTFTITNVDSEGNATGTGDAAYQGATVEITGAAIVNNLIAGSYELKRTSGGPAGTGSTGTASVTYLGEETADADGIATNYVIDPWTDEKTGGSTVTINNATANISDLYGVYYPGYATDDDEQNPSYWADLVTAGTEITDADDGTTWNIVGYTMENTTYADYTSKQYSTALVFGAKFTPADGTVVNSWSDMSFTPGTSTFFRWNDMLYATAEDMMVAAYPNSNNATGKAVFSEGDAFGITTFNDITDKDGLEAFISTLSDNDPTGYKAYLQGIVEADDFDFPTDKSSLYWGNYMQDSIHYELQVYGVGIDTDTRALLYAATDGAVRTYENSQCYYTWWIRHSNDGDNAANGIMEYSIVRNNIYKVRVNSVYSIGGDIPEEGVRAYVYVRNWTMLPSETIDL